ncbi:MAG: Nif11-like leader peptide family natural product precursor [Alphaproteobacteria bacterium]|jgi:predicted ribosomally synthesized peptide with nif11-like leader|nr:Nif11-like leader peptide family natural product precursor [Rhodospirillaceae bacterium]MDG2480831.1 Nif11-like leader peptide family natural product precursor [Alphaproteobacteria bacterium]MBT6206115.1 Nif11-like leader peptide family natural product precursor [Rhodospirillaceae bacterium]MBT6510809.1 Nif11-like leader peptide family natural product precursor [Rhodospirillaceae bacterium]MBT7615640.1 Nif11-like leader peptide family natural product precursor [Rhodospirillaceae bacterium]
MSQSEIERFVEALKNDPELHKQLTAKASGLGSVVEIAQGLGYDFTLDEARSHARSLSNVDLTDDQLEAIAGGGAATVTVEAVAMATTEAIAVESTVNIGAKVEVAAVAVVVLT